MTFRVFCIWLRRFSCRRRMAESNATNVSAVVVRPAAVTVNLPRQRSSSVFRRIAKPASSASNLTGQVLPVRWRGSSFLRAATARWPESAIVGAVRTEEGVASGRRQVPAFRPWHRPPEPLRPLGLRPVPTACFPLPARQPRPPPRHGAVRLRPWRASSSHGGCVSRSRPARQQVRAAGIHLIQER